MKYHTREKIYCIIRFKILYFSFLSFHHSGNMVSLISQAVEIMLIALSYTTQY